MEPMTTMNGYYNVTEADQLFGPEQTIAEAFARFHAQNPRVYDRLVELCRRWVAKRPGQRLGVKMLFERLRWDLAMETTGEPLKLNNNYTALYAREIMEREPDLADLFETRRLRA
jgi:hypothetical protein